jgi:hypothetical protein
VAVLGDPSANGKACFVHAGQPVRHQPMVRLAALPLGYRNESVIGTRSWSPAGYNGQDRRRTAAWNAVWPCRDHSSH